MFGNPIVFVVENENNSSRGAVGRQLKAKGYEVIEAKDSTDATGLLLSWLPDIILLDVDMPVRNGVSILKALKSSRRTQLIPVIMMAVRPDHETRLLCISLGASLYLPKPCDDVELGIYMAALATQKRHTDELEHSSKVVDTLSHVIASRDQQTGDHCGRVGLLAMRIARKLGVQAEGLHDLRMGGMLHDVGKISIPDGILNKPGKLELHEMEIIKGHPQAGVELVREMNAVHGALPLIHYHHERLDGSGYPAGLKGSEIHLLVRILSVADIYDVLGSKRPFKEALPQDKCLGILREEVKRGWWDGEVVEVLAETLSEEAAAPADVHAAAHAAVH